MSEPAFQSTTTTRDNMCAPCRSAYGREHYLANRQKYIDAEARRKRERAETRTKYLIEFFRSHPCADCGEQIRWSWSSTICETSDSR